MPTDWTEFEPETQAAGGTDWSQFKPELTKADLQAQMRQARIEREQGNAVETLAGLGERAAYTAAQLLPDVTGISGHILSRQGYAPLPSAIPEADLATISQFTKEGLGNLGLPEEVTRPSGELVAENVGALAQPKMAAQLMLGVKDPATMARVFQGQMGASIPESVQQTLEAPDLESAIKSTGQTALSTFLPGAIEIGLRPKLTPIPDIPGKTLPIQRGANPPVGEPVGRLELLSPEEAAIAAERMTREAGTGMYARGNPQPVKPKPAKPVVPETPPEPIKEISAVEEEKITKALQVDEVRRENARTKEQIRVLFPEMNRQQAAEIRDLAWGPQEVTEIPKAEEVVTEQTPIPEPTITKPAATTAEVLGRKPEPKPAEPAPVEAAVPVAETAKAAEVQTPPSLSPEAQAKPAAAPTEVKPSAEGPLRVQLENLKAREERILQDIDDWETGKYASPGQPYSGANYGRVARDNVNRLEKELSDVRDQIKAQQPPPQPSAGIEKQGKEGIAEKVVSALESEAEKARARLKSKEGGTTFGSGPFGEIPNIRDFAIIGAAKIARYGLEKTKWAAEMVRDLGNRIQPHLDRIFEEAKALYARTTDVHRARETPVQQIISESVGISKEKPDTATKMIETMQSSIKTARALRDHFTDAPKVNRAEVKAADDWLEADANRIKESLTELAKASLPVSERGRFLTAINNATRRSPILTGDPETMYRRASQVAARIEDRAVEVRKATTASEIKDLVTKTVQSPGVDIGYKQKILNAVRRIAFTKPTEATLRSLKATRDYISRMEAAGKDMTMPKEVLDELEVLGRVPARELPLHVLEAIRDKVQLLDQLGRLKVTERKRVWAIEKANKMQELSQEQTNPMEDRPEFRQQPGDPRPLSMKIRNWLNRTLNIASLMDRALLPIDALLDLLGDAKGNYQGWLFKNVRNPLDLGFNAAQVMRDRLTAPIERIIKANKMGERESERIGVYATAMQEGGIKRLIEMGVKPETIDQIIKSITPAELSVYKEMRKAMDSTLPEIQKLMHELYNINVEPVENYFPMPRDWNLYEPEVKAPAQPKFGTEMDFDDLAGWKQMLGDFTVPKTTKTERGFTIERKPEAQTPIKLNAFDVFFQHINDVAYLLKTQRDLKMIGEMARDDVFKAKYGRIGQSVVLSWLDTVARQGKLGGFRRIPMLDELRKRTSAGVIGFRLASQFVHLSNVPLGIWRTGGPLWYRAGLGEALSERGQKFINENFAETFARGGGEPALVEASQSGLSVFGKTLVPKSVVKAGFAIARQIDRYNAQATTLGTYLRLISEKGLDAANYDKIPVDKEAQARALVLSRRAVASPLPKDVSLSLSRGAVTGGNISLGRTLFQFQNIFQDQWSNIRHDLARAGIREKNPKLAATAFVSLMAMLLLEMGIRGGSKAIIQEVTGYKPKKEESAEEKIALEAIRRIPFGGQLSSQIMYGQTGIPIVDSVVDLTKSAKLAATAKKEATRDKAAIGAVFGAGQLMGIPGSSQIGELIEKSQ